MNQDIVASLKRKDERAIPIVRSYPVTDFVRHVWNFTSDNIPRRDEGYSISNTHYANYMASGNQEGSCCSWLKVIFDSLVRQLSFEEQSVPAEFIDVNNCQFDNHFGALKPDFVYGTLNKRRNRIQWSCLCGLVKKEAQPKRRRKDICISLEALGKKVPWNLRKRPRDDSSNNEEVPSKSRRSERKDTDQQSSRQSPRQKVKLHSESVDALSDRDLQTIACLDALISRSARSYATGFFINETNVSLWYADRMGFVESAIFDFTTHPHLLLLIVAAIQKADIASFGMFPFLRPPVPEFDRYCGGTIILPHATDVDNKKTGKLEFHIVTGPQGVIFNSDAAVSRGTMVFPVVAAGETKVNLGNEKLVVKTSWLVKAWQPEDGKIKIVRNALRHKKPDYLKHVVDLKYSLTSTMGEMKLPRASMDVLGGLCSKGLEERVCRTLVLKAYLPLNFVVSPHEFQVIFTDVVRAHHCIWEVANILHRDISMYNIMFYREHNRAIGVLCDWDLAITHTGRNDGARFGTSVYMAIDLLQPGAAPTHTYFHDLESFFYVLVSFCVSFNPERKTIGEISSWCTQRQDLVLIGCLKRRFLLFHSDYETITRHAHKDYKTLVEGWVFGLRNYFKSAYKGYIRPCMHSRLENEASYEAFMKTLGVDK